GELPAATHNTVRPRRRQKQEIQRPRPAARNCSFSAADGLRHWFHLYHRTRTFPPPVGDQRRFLLCRNTTFTRIERPFLAAWRLCRGHGVQLAVVTAADGIGSPKER